MRLIWNYSLIVAYPHFLFQFLKLLVSLIYVLRRLEEHIHSCCTGISFLFVLESWEFFARQCLVPVAQCCYRSSARTGFVRNQLYSVALTLHIPGNITPSETVWGVIITITKLSNKSDWLSTAPISAFITSTLRSLAIHAIFFFLFFFLFFIFLFIIIFLFIYNTSTTYKMLLNTTYSAYTTYKTVLITFFT